MKAAINLITTMLFMLAVVWWLGKGHKRPFAQWVGESAAKLEAQFKSGYDSVKQDTVHQIKRAR